MINDKRIDAQIGQISHRRHQRDLDRSLKHYAAAIKLKPNIDTSPTLHYLLVVNYAETRRFSEAVKSAEKALDLANAAGDARLIQEINKSLELFKQSDNSSIKH